MKTIKGPAIFLAQFAGDAAPFDNLDSIGGGLRVWATRACRFRAGTAGCSTWKRRPRARPTAKRSRAPWRSTGCEITELSTHLQGQLVAVHPAYDAGFDGFAVPEVRGDPVRRQEWAVRADEATPPRPRPTSGLTAHATFSGALAWPYLYSWPPRPAGLIETAFDELARRWRPILDAFDEAGVDVCYEIHPGEDLHDGVSYEMFLERVGNHPRACLLYDPSHFVLQQLNYLDYIDIYHERIKIFHVKDAEFNPTGRQGVYGGFQSWVDRAGRFRSLGDGQVDFGAIFSKMAAYDFPGWAVLEWECCLKHPEDGAREGRDVHRRPHHPRGRSCVRRLRRRRRRPRRRTRRCSASAERRRTMTIEGSSSAAAPRRIRLGMVGGGQGAFIGGVHRMAARIDDRYELVAGALSSDAGAGRGERGRAAPRAAAELRRLCRHGSTRGGTRGRHRRRRHRHAQPSAWAHRERLSRRRHRRDLRQADDDDARRGARARRQGARYAAPVSR